MRSKTLAFTRERQLCEQISYENWAKKFNLKQLASSMAYLSSHDIRTYDELSGRVDEAVKKNDALLARVQAAEGRLKEIGELKKKQPAQPFLLSSIRQKSFASEWLPDAYKSF